jgi:signal transduction histidine kinase/FixJ family two-component response regulator/HPt (histidine-containing phosphotransfer) domain-containing protein
MSSELRDVAISIPPTDFDAVFPFFFSIDRDLNIERVGTALGGLLPLLRERTASEVFAIIDPGDAGWSYAELSARREHRYVLQIRKHGLKLKGQFVRLGLSELVFLGTPVTEGLTTRDAPPHATSRQLPDVVRLLEMRMSAVEVLEEGNRKLRLVERELVSARDAAEQAVRVKSAFLATISHEVRTPLNAVLGLMDLLRTRPLDSESLEYVSLAQEAGKDLLRIVSDILDFSKMEAGALKIEAIDYNLSQLVSRAVAQYGPSARAKGISIACTLHTEADIWCTGDPLRTSQILSNLLSNAVKFTETGCIGVHLRKYESSFEIEVIDTGIGMSDAALSALFQPFRQADDTVTRRYGGTGLGLAIARGLAERMGGELSGAPVPSCGEATGTQFTLKLPFLAAAMGPGPDSAKTESDVPKSTTHPQTAKRILVAEDHAVNRKLMRGLLVHLGYEAVMAEDGAKALKCLELERFDLVLMDWQMPGIDGISAVKQQRERERAGEAGHRVPILMLTANAHPEDREVCLKAGADDYLTKPITLEGLKAALERWTKTTVVRTRSTNQEPESNPCIAAKLADIVLVTDLAFLRELLDIFYLDAPTRFAAASEAIETRTKHAVAMQAHTLRGSALNLGLESFVSVCERLEAAAQTDDYATMVTALASLETEYAQARIMLECCYRSHLRN